MEVCHTLVFTDTNSACDNLSIPILVFNLNFFSDLETNECLDKNGGCWQDSKSNVTACKVHRLDTNAIEIAFDRI